MKRIEKVEIYKTTSGEEPLMLWIRILDKVTRGRIKKRIERVTLGNLGDWKSIDGEIYELRMHFGGGQRIYFCIEAGMCIHLLCGGNKSRQKKDIVLAKRYLTEYRSR